VWYDYTFGIAKGRNGSRMEEFQFELVEQLGTVSENAKGWRRELTLIRWNGRAPKYDLRDWAPDRLKMGKGISMTRDEAKSLRDLLNSIPFDHERSEQASMLSMAH
jgi:hypothetical protein